MPVKRTNARKEDFYPRICLPVMFATCLLLLQNVVLDAVWVVYLRTLFLC